MMFLALDEGRRPPFPALFLSRQGVAKDLERNFRALLQSALGRNEYVTLEEFEAQKRVLERTRRKVEALEQALAEIESKDA